MITKELIIGDIIRLYPQTMAIFERYGLNCFDCQIADLESLDRSAKVHNADVEALLKDLNQSIAD